MKRIIYLNSSFISMSEAVISPEDRGFNFADGVYEVVKYYQGRPFRMEDHLERLKYSLGEVGIPYSPVEELPGIFGELLLQNNLESSDAGIYLQITRGAAPRVHHFPAGLTPTVYAAAFPFPSFSQSLEAGIPVVTAKDIRWLRCDIKSVSLLPNTMLYNSAVEIGAGECILVRDGMVTEATRSSVFGIRNNTVYTHPLSNLILPGITRKVILEICAAEGISCEEKAFTEQELLSMDEVFLSGTGSEVMPVVSINGIPLSDGVPGPVTRRLQTLFFDAVSRHCRLPGRIRPF
jgi:D-alanine transaminase